MKQQKSSQRSRILDVVQRYTEASLDNPSKEPGLHAGRLAGELGLNRANVSKELNTLYKLGLVIKFQGKPTYYLCKNTVSSHYGNQFFPSTIPKGKTLADYIYPSVLVPQAAGRTASLGFHELVGQDGSLRQAILYAKAAVAYPSRDMHILLTGAPGTEKAQFSRMIYQFALESGALPADAPYVVCDCQGYENSPRQLMAQIFGQVAAGPSSKSLKGLLERAAGGILCLDGIERLPPLVQDRLITVLEQRTYTRVGNSASVRHNTAIILAVSGEPADSPLIGRFSRSMPIHIALPCLEERGVNEIFAHVAYLLEQEAAATGISFQLSKDILFCLLQAGYPGNINELEHMIRAMCALAYLEYLSAPLHKEVIDILPSHIPQELLSQVREDAGRSVQARQLLARLPSPVITFSPGCTTSFAGLFAAQEEDRKASLEGAIPVLLVYHGTGIAEATASYINTFCGRELVRGISCRSDMQLDALLKAAASAAKEMDQGSGVLIITDMEPLETLHEYISGMAGIQAETVSQLSLSQTLALCQRVSCSRVPVHEFIVRDSVAQEHIFGENTAFINRIVNDILSSSLTFLNPTKAANILLDTLEQILQDLHIAYTDEIAIKFIFHCSHMLERLIRGNSLKYDRLRSFVNENGHIFDSIENRMRYPAEIFGASIPTSEIAYIVELFQPYL